jgi:hypothetical protein
MGKKKLYKKPINLPITQDMPLSDQDMDMLDEFENVLFLKNLDFKPKVQKVELQEKVMQSVELIPREIKVYQNATKLPIKVNGKLVSMDEDPSEQFSEQEEQIQEELIEEHQEPQVKQSERPRAEETKLSVVEIQEKLAHSASLIIQDPASNVDFAKLDDRV